MASSRFANTNVWYKPLAASFSTTIQPQLTRFQFSNMRISSHYYCSAVALILSSSKRYISDAFVLSSSKARNVHQQYYENNNLRCLSTAPIQGAKVDSTETAKEDNSPRGEYSTSYHAPVMWRECVEAILGTNQLSDKGVNISTPDCRGAKRNRVFVDGTLGGGGHSEALLQRLQPHDIVIGCDIDPDALDTATKRLFRYMHHDGCELPHFVPVHTNFGNLASVLPDLLHPVTQQPIRTLATDSVGSDSSRGFVDGILLDLGVSSYQIDTAERGFAFMKDGPLDMRMGGTQQTRGVTAADLCNELDVSELQRIFSAYGDERRSKTIAQAIVRHRPLSTTLQLVNAIGSVTPTFAKHKRNGLTATCARIFQSLRIVVNREDTVLEQVLTEACPMLLRRGGRLVVLSYHSMEDRATKRVMRDGSVLRVRVEHDVFGNPLGPPKPFKPVGKRLTAATEEVEANPRARSASLRTAERL